MNWEMSKKETLHSPHISSSLTVISSHFPLHSLAHPIPFQPNSTQPNATHELPHYMMTQHQPQHTQHKHRSIQSAKDITAETNTSTKSNPSASHAPSHSTTSPRPNGASTCNRTPAHRPISQSTRPCSTPTIESWDSIFPPAAI